MINSSLKKISFFDVLSFAAKYWFKQPKTFLLIMMMVLVAAILETYLPNALSALLGSIREQQDKTFVLHYLIIFLGVYLVQTMLFALNYIIYNGFETHLFKSLVDDVFTHIYTLPETFFANTFTGSIISKIYRARQKIEVFEDQILLRIFSTLVILIGSLSFLAFLFPLLALLLTLYFIVFIAISAFFVFYVSGPAQGIYAEEQDHFNANLADSISGIVTTKAYAQETFELSRFFSKTETLRLKNRYAYQLGNLATFIQRFLLAGMLALLMGGGVWYYFHGMASVENMAYLAFAYTIMQNYIQDVGENIKNLLTSSYDLHAVIRLLQEKPEVIHHATLPALNIHEGKIVFDNVTFTYPHKKTAIFNNLSVEIKPGERVALVGHSGGGKTSFVRLIQCLYPIQQGKILIDNQDINLYSRQSLRSKIALVPQEPILFHRTLAENIAYAKPTARLDEIKHAAEKAYIQDFIMNQPEGYETLVGERGIKLSGGERQRIAIARAILADRPILILDEATSSLDSASERAIQNALLALTHGRTSIIIAHRLSTILDADRILVFDAGRIVEQGTHDELLLHNGIYAHLFKLQSGGFILEN